MTDNSKSVLIMMAQIFVFCSEVIKQSNAEVDPNKSIVWGPGLRPDIIVMPARYFYIEAFDTTRNEMYYKSPGNVFKVEISGNSKHKHCRIWVNTLDRQDGSFIVRYKMYHTCTDVKIEVKYNNIHVAESPYKIKGSVHAEECYCPVKSLKQWLKEYGCPESYEQIKVDLKSFPSVNFTEHKEAILQKYNHPGSMSICNYVIKGNQVYRKCYGRYVGFKMFIDAILLSITRKAIIPDVEMFFNLGDWPLVKKDEKPHYPIFSWCGSDDSLDIVLPTYDITEATLECMGRVMLDMLSVQGNIDKRWQEKIEKVFWRGRDSRRERLNLIDIAREHPDLINASLTNFFFFKDEEEKYGPKVKHESFFKFFDIFMDYVLINENARAPKQMTPGSADYDIYSSEKITMRPAEVKQYKYQLNIDGTVAAYRFPYLLAGDSLVFKQESKYYEFFYKLLEPWKHFVPVKSDLSDLIEKILWAKENDEKARRIAEAGRRFAQENLMPQDVFCYHGTLIYEWSKHLVSNVVVEEDMELVKQPVSDKPYEECLCEERNAGKDEL